MNDFYQFVKEENTVREQLDGRAHLWHFNPDIAKEAQTCFVKIVMKEGGFHDFHRHPEMNEILYVLKGDCEQWVENEKQLLYPGDSVYIAPDVVHGTFNAGHETLEFLAVLSPASGWDAGTIDMSNQQPYSTYR